jgi:hypothetical protein
MQHDYNATVAYSVLLLLETKKDKKLAFNHMLVYEVHTLYVNPEANVSSKRGQ